MSHPCKPSCYKIPFMREIVIAFITLMAFQVFAQDEIRVELSADMLTADALSGDANTIIDEQREIIGEPAGKPSKGWRIPFGKDDQLPAEITLDLKRSCRVSKIWFYDTNSAGDVDIFTGTPDNWKKTSTYDCGFYNKWVAVALDAETRYIKLARKSPSANFSEIAIYEYSDDAWKAMVAKKEEEARVARERAEKIARAMEEMKKRPLVDLGEPFGKLYLVDEIDCSVTKPEHEFVEQPAGSSKVTTILGRKARVLPPVAGTSSYFTYRIGKMKLLQPGASYVIAVDYPEDSPRTMIISNTGCESIRGFHTGPTVGDAFHPLYVNNLNESTNTPLSGKWETWTQYFQLHDRFPAYNELPRGGAPRKLVPEDGFNVTICQFSKRNMPMSHGLAVSRIRLYAVPNPNAMTQPLASLPEDLPKRRITWREEMADGVIGEVDRKRTAESIGVTNFLDWYRYKTRQMKFLGINTFSKDLLEFGANQGWDSTPYGGNDWVYFGSNIKHWWENIVTLMGEEGFDVLPYYEYSGSKGKNGLGNQKRSKTLTGKSTYTHIKWIENANADITDPDTYEDFRKMMELTVVRLKNKADFVGV